MSKFKQPPAFHCHPQSLDTGSAPEAFIKREKELGSVSVTCTDHGSLGAVRLISRLAKKEGLIPQLGGEFYLRDDNCPILSKFGIEHDKDNTFRNYNKYYHFTAHFGDFEAYSTASRLLSDAPNERHGTENKPIFNWKMIEELSDKNIVLGSGCLIGGISRHIFSGRFDIAEEYYKKFRSLTKNFYVEVFPHICDKKWIEGVFFDFDNGKQLKFHVSKKLKTERGEFTAEEIAHSRNPHHKLLGIRNYRKWDECDWSITKAEFISDFIPNEPTEWAPDGDMQLVANKFAISLAKKYGDKIVISLDAHIATPEDKIVQDVRLTNAVTGHSWKFANSYHLMSADEMFIYFKNKLDISEKEYEQWIDNGLEAVDKVKNFEFDNTISLPARFYPSDSVGYLKTLIDKHGKMDWSNSSYVERLRKEVELFHYNGTMDLLPYFFMCEDIATHAEFMGCGRGSAGGVFLSYLLGIIAVNPFKWNLSLDRFLTLDRIKSGKLPDIDMDFPGHVRDYLVTKYLPERFGEHFAAIATNTSFRTKSAIKDIDRALHGKVRREIEEICRGIPTTPQGISDQKFIFGYKDDDGNQIKGLIETNKSLQKYVEDYPAEWKLVSKFYGVSRGHGVHASAHAVANRPIKELMQLLPSEDIKITSFIDDDVEEAGVIKVDILGVNTLEDVYRCIKLINKDKKLRNDEIIYKDKIYSIWDLPDEQVVYDKMIEGDTKTTFQLDSIGARKLLKYWDCTKFNTDIPLLSSIRDLAMFTALDRPGALDAYVTNEDGSKHNMMIEYIKRASENKLEHADPAMLEILPETFGMSIFQEDISKVFRILGETTGIEAEAFRNHVGKKLLDKVLEDKNIFLKGAIRKVGKKRAENIWEQLESWSRYGFNKSHSTVYALTAYATAFLKYFFPIEWWTAVLSNADKNDISEKFWNQCAMWVDPPDINLSTDTYTTVNGRIRAPIDLLQGVGPAAHQELCSKKPYKDISDLIHKIYVEKNGRSSVTRGTIIKLIISGVMDSLFEKNLSFLDKIALFNSKLVELGVKKKPEPIDESIINLNYLGRYQLKKSILPMYGENLVKEIITNPLIKDKIHKEFINNKEAFYIKYNGRFNDYPILSGLDLENLTQDMAPFAIRAAGIGYVLKADKFSFTNKTTGNKQEALKIFFEVENSHFELVKWECLKGLSISDIEGSILAALLYMGKGKNSWSISDFIMIQNPLGSGSSK